MTKIWIARRKEREALLLPTLGTRKKPWIIIPLNDKLERSELDELVRGQLEKQGVSSESAVHNMVEKAEQRYEQRIKTKESSERLNQYLEWRKQGLKLMQVAFRKWAPVFYRPKKEK